MLLDVDLHTERDKNAALFPKSDPAHMPGLVVPLSEINVVSWGYCVLDAFEMLFLSPLYCSVWGMFFCPGWLVSHVVTYLLLTKVYLREFSSEAIQSMAEKISS